MHRRTQSIPAPSPTVISFPLEEPSSSTAGYGSSHPPRPGHISSAVSPKLGHTSDFYSGLPSDRSSSSASRWAFYNRKKLAQVGLLIVCIVALWRSGAHEHPIVEHAVGRATDHSCRAFPYLARCLSQDPFKGLSFPALRPGELSYPALRTGAPSASSEAPPAQPHPIHKLIRDARSEWDRKLAGQSETLEAAVREYRRRYNQPPPRGFDKWFAWAREHNVRLLDEYDNIHERILPFASLPRILIQERAAKLRDDPTFWMREMGFTIRIDPQADADDGRLSASGPMLEVNPRAGEVMKLLRGIEHLIPTELNVTLTGHDTPWVVVSGEARERHVEAAKAHRFVWEKDWERVGELVVAALSWLWGRC